MADKKKGCHMNKVRNNGCRISCYGSLRVSFSTHGKRFIFRIGSLIFYLFQQPLSHMGRMNEYSNTIFTQGNSPPNASTTLSTSSILLTYLYLIQYSLPHTQVRLQNQCLTTQKARKSHSCQSPVACHGGWFLEPSLAHDEIR